MEFLGRLHLDEQGTWFHEGEPVVHAKLHELLNRSVRWSERQRSFVLISGSREISFTFSVSPLFVISTTTSPEPRWLLSNGEELAMESPISVSSSHRWGIDHPSSGMTIVFSRSLQQQLSASVLDEQTLAVFGKRVTVQGKAP